MRKSSPGFPRYWSCWIPLASAANRLGRVWQLAPPRPASCRKAERQPSWSTGRPPIRRRSGKPRPRLAQTTPRSLTAELVKIVAGGAIGCCLAMLILWWVFGADPFAAGPRLGRFAPWIVPAKFRRAARTESPAERPFSEPAPSSMDSPGSSGPDQDRPGQDQFGGGAAAIGDQQASDTAAAAAEPAPARGARRRPDEARRRRACGGAQTA